MINSHKSLASGFPTVIRETRSLPVGEFFSPIAQLARLIPSYDFLHFCRSHSFNHAAALGFFSTARRDFSSAPPHHYEGLPSVCPLTCHDPLEIYFRLKVFRYLRSTECRFRQFYILHPLKKKDITKGTQFEHP